MILNLSSKFIVTACAAVITRLLTLVTVSYLVRIFDVELFGKIGFADSLVGYFVLISDLGLQTLAVREISRNRTQPIIISKIVNGVISIQLVTSLIFFIVLCIYALYRQTRGSVDSYLIILFALAMIFPYVFSIEWWLNGTERLHITALLRLVRELLFTIGIFVFVHSAKDVLLVPVIQGIAWSIIAIYICIIYHKQTLTQLNLNFEFAFWKNLLGKSMPIAVTGIVGHFWLRSGTIFLGFLSTDKDVGIFNAIWKLFMLGIEFHSLLSLSVFPIFAKAFDDDSEKFIRVRRMYQFVTSTIAVVIVIIALMFSPSIISIVLGSAYKEGNSLFIIMMCALSLWYFGSSYGVPLLATNFEKYVMIQTLAGLSVNLILNLIFIPESGAMGASVAYLISVMFAITLSVVFFFTKMNESHRR